MFAQRSRVRRLAAYMLLVWVMALSAGVVNACVIEPDLHHATQLAGESSAGHGEALVHDQVEQDGHPTDSSAHEHSNPGSAPSQCIKFCDDESTSVPSGRVQSEPMDPVHWLMLTTAIPASAPVGNELVAWVMSPSAWVPHRQGPILYAFLRLAL